MPRLKNILPKKKLNSGNEEVFHYSVEDYDRTFLIPRRILKLVSLRLTRKDSPKARLFWDTFYWFTSMLLVVAGAQQTINILKIVRERPSFHEAIDVVRSMPCDGYVYLALSKSYYYMVKRPVYENLVNELREMWPKGFVSREEHLIVNKAVKQLMYVTRGYYYCNILLMGIFMLPPFIAIFKRLIGYDAPYLMPFYFWYPFDPFQPIVYEIALFLQTWLGSTVVLEIVSGDLLFCIFLSHITTQFDLLSLRITKLFYVPIDDQLSSYPLGEYSKEYLRKGKQDLDRYDGRKWETVHEKELVAIIERHRALIRLAADMENLNGFQLLVNFFNSSILLCFCGFCCVIVEKITELIYKIFLTAILLQTWLLCWYGHRLLESSFGISNALYNSGWYTTSKKIQKIVFIMIHRAQKHVCVTTYGFSVISLASYTTIIKTAWSYFTLLLNIYKK